ncbi:hypothetical protein HN51_019525 [Arachis hypogaea]|uniref:Uncharacterized protein n=2 Tax=Arachis TaxID=3817 RepID=A0A445BX89_ARAHY|nr:photosystem II repair protein PSB27-H1, chloroplastic [Arachis duranensis]XP_025614457.1 photosystem II repair protein PSB27-H1, chloroplastic [Arachis hypogaea]XP_057728312.1 photosystem II repair protein PSB27-H1, chloroplastic [Arachis stenosperma]QHO31308.1 Photosystem II repair protein-H1 [Arachis hypogaea]RYR43337.1 hypothetical protein Ahy_A08g039757 [Arachis hypogaea]
MASPTLITPTSTPKSSLPLTTNTTVKPKPSSTTSTSRRELFFSITAVSSSLLAAVPIMVAPSALAAEDEEYVKETEEVINKVRTTITMDKNDPNVAAAVAELRDTSNSWVAKYRREKALLGRASFRDMYSALNAVSGHYISFGPTAPIPAKRRARILEEVDTAEKALKRGR